MTIHKLTAGDGYTYLTRQVAGGDVQRERGQDAASYYTAEGNPPGRWAGRGAPLLGLAGQLVSEDQMRALFGEGMHPDADAIIAAYLAERVRAGMSAARLARLREEAVRAARLGAAFPVYAPLDHFQARLRRRLDAIEAETGRQVTAAEVKEARAQESRRSRAAVAGFDVVFAPVKSAALLWALDERPEVRAAVRQAHDAARDAALELLEEHAAFTRSGKSGLSQIGTMGLIAAVFDHYDSRAGDPNLHTHVAISSKVRGADGKWRSLDARGLYRMTVAASEFYNTAFEAELTARLPVTFAGRADTTGTREPIREITGVPLAFIEHFSARRTEIETRYQQLLRQFRREHGYDPSRGICHQLARQANLETRQGKKTVRSLAAMRADWAQSLTDAFGTDAITTVMAASPGTGPAAPRAAGPAPDLTALARRVVANVAEMRSVWTVWNLRAEAERLARAELALPSPARHREIVAAIVTEAVSPRLSIPVEPAPPLAEPAELRRGDGTSVFTQHQAARYTSRQILAAEERLLAAAATRTAVGLSGPLVAASLEGFDAQGTQLDAGQRQLVTCFATDSRLLVAGLGPAGAGKTTAMRAYAHVAAQAGQRIVALATSAAAAGVLSAELGVRAENLHKFLHEHTAGPHARQLRSGEPVTGQAAMFALRPGDAVLVDEAGMAGTLALDRLVTIAAARGAVVRLLGDHRQLGSVESGGALRLIASEAGAVRLSTLYRFRDPAEADATLKIRIGDSAGLDFYLSNDRVRSGSRQAMTEGAYAAWKADMLAGKTTLMAAAGVNVTALSAQARLERAEAGQVEPGGVKLADGNLAGAGDWITTRRNDRRLPVFGGRDWVKNGDAWAVTTRHPDGSLTVRHLEHRGRIRLPAGYVSRDVELMYATTANRAQGSTVDTAHPLITADMSREHLYVITSRARQRTTLHVVTHELLSYDPDERLDKVKNDARMYAAREILENILTREGNQLSATETIRDARRHAASLATLIPRHQHAATILAARRYNQIARQILGGQLAARLAEDPGWQSAIRALIRAETLGWQPERLLAAATRPGELAAADAPGSLLARRISTHVEDQPVPARLQRPSLADATRYAALLRPVTAGLELDPRDAIAVPAGLTFRRQAGNAASRRQHVPARTLARYAEITSGTLGTSTARVTGHKSWPHLAGALAAADREGRDLSALLAAAVSAWNGGDGQADQLTAVTRITRRLLRASGACPADLAVPANLGATQAAAAALGIDTAVQARSEPAWPALAAALRRAEDAGHQPAEMLRTVARSRELYTAASVSEVLAWRLGRYQRTAPLLAPSGQGAEAPAETWRTLAWTLKAAENAGRDVSEVLDLERAAGLTAILASAQRDAGPAPAPSTALLPWVRNPSDPGSQLGEFLAASASLITARVNQLTSQAISEQASWTRQLGTPPADPALRPEWERHVGIVAAYRDQHQVGTDGPGQILGPYVLPARAERAAYWQAADSVFRARTLAGLRAPQRPTRQDDQDQHRIATDIYLALAEPARAAVTAVMAERLGQLWLGRADGAGDATVNPAYARQLCDSLTELGHLRAASQAHEPTASSGSKILSGQGRNEPVDATAAERHQTEGQARQVGPAERARQGRQQQQSDRRQQRAASLRRQRGSEQQGLLQRPPAQQSGRGQDRQYGK